MDRQIRRLGIAFVALFAVLFAQVAYVQVVAADRIASEPANAPRQIKAEYAVERGQILAANRTTDPRQVDREPRHQPRRTSSCGTTPVASSGASSPATTRGSTGAAASSRR